MIVDFNYQARTVTRMAAQITVKCYCNEYQVDRQWFREDRRSCDVCGGWLKEVRSNRGRVA